MKRSKYLAAGLLLFCGIGIVFAAVAPRQDYTSDTSTRIRERTLEMMEQSSQDLGWRFITDTANDTAQDLTGANSVLWLYRDTNHTWSVTVTGSVELATNGQVLVEITPSQLNTNGTFEWILTVSDGSDTMAYAYGDLVLDANPTRTSGTLPVGTNLNWLTFSNYMNTVSHGPYRAGTNITMTANSDGSADVNFNVASQARGDVAVYDGTNWVRVANGTTGQTFTALGAGLLPTWTAAAAGDITGIVNVSPLAGGGLSGTVTNTFDYNLSQAITSSTGRVNIDDTAFVTNGMLGVGTNAPRSRLHVVGTGTVNETLGRFEDNNGTNKVLLEVDDDGDGFIGVYDKTETRKILLIGSGESRIKGGPLELSDGTDTNHAWTAAQILATNTANSAADQAYADGVGAAIEVGLTNGTYVATTGHGGTMPAFDGNSGNSLRGDGTWAAAGGGSSAHTYMIGTGDWEGDEVGEGSLGTGTNNVVWTGYSTANATNNSKAGDAWYSSQTVLNDKYYYGQFTFERDTDLAVESIAIGVRSSSTGATTNRVNILMDDTKGNTFSTNNLVSSTADEWNWYNFAAADIGVATWTNTLPNWTEDGGSRTNYGLNVRADAFSSHSNSIQCKVEVRIDTP
jgi:hypothetical protein